MIREDSPKVFVVTCDDCGDEVRKVGSFLDVVNGIKNNGWKNTKIDNEWKNYCPDCSPDNNSLHTSGSFGDDFYV